MRINVRKCNKRKQINKVAINDMRNKVLQSKLSETSTENGYLKKFQNLKLCEDEKIAHRSVANNISILG